MHGQVVTFTLTDPIGELVPAMSNRGLHHVPVVDGEGVFVGVVSHSDLLGALFESRLVQQT